MTETVTSLQASAPAKLLWERLRDVVRNEEAWAITDEFLAAERKALADRLEVVERVANEAVGQFAGAEIAYYGTHTAHKATAGVYQVKLWRATLGGEEALRALRADNDNA